MSNKSENELQALLFNFSQNPSLFVDRNDEAEALRQKLKCLLGLEDQEPNAVLRAITVMKAILLCPEIIEVKGRPGFERIAEEFFELLLRQAIARLYGAREEELFYGNKPSRTRYRALSRRECTFAGIFSIAWQGLGKRGTPGRMARDWTRAVQVHIIQKINNLDEDGAIDYLAAIEHESHYTGNAMGRIDKIGTGSGEILADLVYGIRNFVRDERIQSSSTSGSLKTQIQRSIDRIKARYELKEIPSEGSEWPNRHGAIVAVPRASGTVSHPTPRKKTSKPGSRKKNKRTGQ